MIGAVAKQVANPQLVKSALWTKVPARTIYPQMSSNHIAGMPRVRIPFAEKVAAGLFISTCILATPAWIVTHLDDYRGGAAEAR